MMSPFFFSFFISIEKPNILDLWIPQKGLISAARTSSPFLLGINCTIMKWKTWDGIKNVINIRAQLFFVEGWESEMPGKLDLIWGGLRGAGDAPSSLLYSEKQASAESQSPTGGSFKWIKKQWHTKGKSNANSHYQALYSSLFCF